MLQFTRTFRVDRQEGATELFELDSNAAPEVEVAILASHIGPVILEKPDCRIPGGVCGGIVVVVDQINPQETAKVLNNSRVIGEERKTCCAEKERRRCLFSVDHQCSDIIPEIVLHGLP